LKILRSFILIFLLGGFALLLYEIIPSKDAKEEVKNSIQTDESIRLEGLYYTEWKDDRLSWVLDANNAVFRHRENEAVFKGVAVVFYPDTGGRMHLHADQVVYDNGTRDLTAEGKVWGESDQGYRFYTNRIFYDAEAEEVSTQDKVTFKKDRLIIRGVGVAGSVADHRFELLSAVRAEFSLKDAVH